MDLPSKPMKPSGRLTGGNDMDAIPSVARGNPEQENPGDVERLEAILDGHMQMIQYLQNIHDAQFAPYCNLFIERIEKEILPILEEAIVAAKILLAMDETLPKMTLQNLNKRIQEGLSLPAYDGGALHDH